MIQWVMDMAAFSGTSRLLGREALVAILLAGLMLSALSGCESTTYAESIRVTAEAMNTDGLFAKVEFLRDGKLANSVHLVDGDGDGVVDGKSGPKSVGTWPVGWEWFDDLYKDTVVGETTMSFDSQKVVVSAAKTYEFMVGEYEVRSAA